ncbi:MAG: DUF1593 domain-containing protein [Bacteroidales bacterium]|nr:DUF1593 domain-containing protein [Bacteroidales bacterium]
MERSPGGNLGVDNFSVRWSGQVKPLYTETYTFETETDDGARLWVNGQEMFTGAWKDQGPTKYSGTIGLTAGQKYDIVFEFYENGGGALAALRWSSASQAYQIISQSQLYSDVTPTVSIIASDATAIETGGNTGTFTISRNTTAGSLNATYTLGGTASSADYTPSLSGNVSFADGTGSVNIQITPVSDGIAESTETLTLCIEDGPDYNVGTNSCATINIQDEVVVSDKPRVVILTDISNEPDDQQSLVRALMYSNDVDIEGLIAGTSCWKTNNPDDWGHEFGN